MKRNHGRYTRDGMIVLAVRIVEPLKAWPLWADEIRASIKKDGLPVMVGFFYRKKAMYGDWIVFSDDGEFYVYRDAGFRRFYQRLDNDATPCAEKALYQGLYQSRQVEVG